jgi:hypothetical protein
VERWQHFLAARPLRSMTRASQPLMPSLPFIPRWVQFTSYYLRH